MTVEDILHENHRRNEANTALFNPITGEGSVGARFLLALEDAPISKQYLPHSMKRVPLIQKLTRAGSIKAFIEQTLKADYSPEAVEQVVEQLVRVRMLHDFPFWAALYVMIKAKGGGRDMHFRLNRPQRKLVARLEEMRLSAKPIRLILLKARQWGGSTCIQLYMAWLQLVHREGLNSLIVGHVNKSSTEVKFMFERMLKDYPLKMLYQLGETYTEGEPKMIGVGTEPNIKRVPQRNFNIKIGSAESPDSARGGDYNLVHCTEVGLWKKTEGKTPEDIVRSACSGILYAPYTMIVYESTANGTGNFFHREYQAAKEGESQFEALFIAWYDIDQYALDFVSPSARRALAHQLLRDRHKDTADNNRSESGRYLWYLWTCGATLEAIYWYITERKKFNDHAGMASEYPSDDVEAFVHSGAMIFDRYQVEALRKACRSPKHIGEVVGAAISGKDALQNLHFVPDTQGKLWVWDLPDVDPEERIKHRYLVVVDIGGRSDKADYSVIAVFDRLFMMDGGKPVVVAQWRGHIDHDLLAWRAAQIARFYDNALLVIESNTLETRDRERQVDGDLSHYILHQIKEVYGDQLYARRQSPEDIIEGRPLKYGFHTNTHTKPAIIANLQQVIRDESYVERDERCLDEYLCYERKPNGSVGAILGKHDDMLMTRAIGLFICMREMPLPQAQAHNQSLKPPKRKGLMAGV